jgi:murein DD-endopeptidase MepM/ murein hydrolase activator NlpD
MKLPLKGLTVLFLPDSGEDPRSFHLSPRGVRVALGFGIVGLVGTLIMAGSWWYLALQTGKTWTLQAHVDSLEVERTSLLAVAEEMVRIEGEYAHIRSLFAPESDPVSSGLWLPPTGLSGGRERPEDPGSDEHLPTSWPLTEPGFVTQALVEGGTGEHPGLDIAVATGSYIRAAGAGQVLRIGEDPLYGLFVVLEHGEGFQTVYAHTSMILVERGQSVRRHEVIALTGSTGRSTAAHLHFEILLEGVPVDPYSMVEQPS